VPTIHELHKKLVNKEITLIQILSLIAPGIPASGEIASPLAIASSTTLAIVKARS